MSNTFSSLDALQKIEQGWTYYIFNQSPKTLGWIRCLHDPSYKIFYLAIKGSIFELTPVEEILKLLQQDAPLYKNILNAQFSNKFKELMNDENN